MGLEQGPDCVGCLDFVCEQGRGQNHICVEHFGFSVEHELTEDQDEETS